MRIITVNLPRSYIKAIDTLVGGQGLYPSRSELIRVAVRDFLIRELEAAKSFQHHLKEQIAVKRPAKLDESLYVQVPLGENAEGVKEFKTYRIVKKE